MTEASALKQIVRIVEQKTGIAPGGLSLEADTPLSEVWLMLASVQVVEFVVELESLYDVSLPDELLGRIGESSLTVADLAAMLEGKEEMAVSSLLRVEEPNR